MINFTVGNFQIESAYKGNVTIRTPWSQENGYQSQSMTIRTEDISDLQYALQKAEQAIYRMKE